MTDLYREEYRMEESEYYRELADGYGEMISHYRKEIKGLREGIDRLKGSASIVGYLDELKPLMGEANEKHKEN